MKLKDIYRPLQRDLAAVDDFLDGLLKKTKRASISRVTDYLLESRGKKIRPALLILSLKAARTKKAASVNASLVKVASAFELIHAASLIHDDVIDKADLRHNRPTVNRKWGGEASIALGDYLFSLAFALIAECKNFALLGCVSSAVKAMCEGELLQVLERHNLNLSREQYFLIVKKKTAALFLASCRAGGLIAKANRRYISALSGYGLNFGIAFQIADDYLDLMGERRRLGKRPGQDIKEGEVTLPLLNLWESASTKDKEDIERIISSGAGQDTLAKIRQRLISSSAIVKTKEEAASFMDSAKEELEIMPQSPYKDALFRLADFVLERGFGRAVN